METRDRPPSHKPKLWEHHGLLWEARRAWESSTAIATRGVAGASGRSRGTGASPRGAAAAGVAGTPSPRRPGTPAGPAGRRARQRMREGCQKSLFTAKVATLFLFFFSATINTPTKKD